jgi:hypothetical protein
VTDALEAAGPLDGRIVIDAANSFGQQQLSLRSLAGAFPRARWVRAFNSLSVGVMADDNHREPPWVLFLSGDEQAKPAAAQLIRDAGFDPVDLGGIDDSQLQDPGSALWTYTVTHDEATALVARIKSGDTVAADPLTAPFEKFRDTVPGELQGRPAPTPSGTVQPRWYAGGRISLVLKTWEERNRDHGPSFPGFMTKFIHDTALTQFTDGGGIRFASVSSE